MGTRNLVAVFSDGEYRVAQYGQWDGYPSGQGVSVLSFISDKENVEKLKAALSRVRFFDEEGKDKELIESYEKNAPQWSSDPDNRTPEQKHWFKSYISRDLGADILTNIANSTDEEIILRNSINFAGDSLFCEFAYVVDLDEETFEVYEGFNKDELARGERFKDIPIDHDSYKQVKHLMMYSLNDLPTEEVFLSDTEPSDD